MTNACTQFTDRECREEDCCLIMRQQSEEGHKKAVEWVLNGCKEDARSI